MLYHELLIRLDPAPGGGFLARVMGYAAGQASGPLDLHLDDRLLSRLAEDQSDDDLRELGFHLRDALFSQPIRDAFLQLWGKMGEEEGLRIRLQAAPEATPLFALPWEALAWPHRSGFLSLDRRAVLVRSIDLPVGCPPLLVRGPLRILVVASAPRGRTSLDLAGEIERLEAAVSDRENVSVDVLKPPELGALRTALVSGGFHILHFMGHGDLDPSTGKGRLLFEADGQAHPVLGEDLAIQLKGISSLRLVVLNACRTACAAHAGPFASVGTALLEVEIPAVVAMQLPLSDQAALAFSRELYGRLAAGDPLEAAVAEGRLALHRDGRGSGEWVTPVLFLRSADGQIFGSLEEPEPLEKPEPLPPQPPRRLWALAELVIALLLGILAWNAYRGLENRLERLTTLPAPEPSQPMAIQEGRVVATKPVLRPPERSAPAPRKVKPSAPKEVSLAEGKSLEIEAWQATLSVDFLDEDLQEMLGGYKHEVTARLFPSEGGEQTASLVGPGTREFRIEGKTVRLSVIDIDWDAKTVRLLLPQTP